MLRRIFAFTLLGLIILSAVFYDSEPKPRLEDVDFHVQESEALYFRNLRQIYYSKEVRDDAQFDIFRLKGLELDSGEAEIGFAIINNWLHDQAYIKLEATDLAMEGDSIYLMIQHDESDTTLSLGNEGMQSHLNIAVQIYKAMASDASIFTLRAGEGQEEIWNETERRNSIKRLLKDYFKLIGALR